MAKRKDTRVVKRRVKRKWVECKMKDLEEGDEFRLWEADGTIVRNDGKYVFTVKSTPVFNKHGARVWAVEIEQ